LRFSTRLILGATAIVLITTTTTVVGVRGWLRSDLESEFTRELEREVRIVAVAISTQPSDLNLAAHRYGVILGRRVTLIDTQGRVVGDSDFDDSSLAFLENHLHRPEVEDALRAGIGVDRRVSASTNRAELKVAISSWPGVVRVSAPVEQIDAVVRDATEGVLAAGAVAVFVGMVLAVLTTRAVGRPVRDLASATRAVASGAAPVYPQSTIPEVRALVHAYRSMHEELRRRLSDLEREREETSTMLESMVQGVLAADKRGVVTICNAAMRGMLGYDDREPIPNLTELFHRKEARDLVEQVMAGKNVPAREVELEGRAVLITARPLPTGGAVLGLWDISDVRRVENVRRDFVANVSHELKTPLTNILGYSATLLGDEVDPATREGFLSVIHHNARRMHHLVDDLLSLARVESGAWVPNPEPVDIEALARDAWQISAESVPDCTIEFALNIEPDVALTTDRDALHRILTNLIDNALRHTPPGGTIRVGARNQDEAVELVVQDTGSGIPAEHLSRVFERFYRVDPGRSREAGGTGLGLSIVKHLVETQRGSVDLESTLGRGTTVRIRFPRMHANAGNV
jgi:two-component system, OmpR family, phosphate regulon sensor histidine kinase PhoR